MIIQADARYIPLADESVQSVVTSPPYWGLRDYGIEPSVWGGDPLCGHEWNHNRYYVVGGGSAQPSAEAFSKPGEANAKRIKEARWREDDICLHCHAWRSVLGLEPDPRLYVEHIVQVFREIWRVLRKDGTVWLNLGSTFAGSWGNYHPDSPPGKHGQRLKETARWNRPAYSSQEFLPPTANCPGFKPKDLVPIPWLCALALQQDGWWLRSDIIWWKDNPMPGSQKDRPTGAHEYIFLLAKSGDTILWRNRRTKEWVREKRPKPHYERVKVFPNWGEGENSRRNQDRDPNHPSERKVRKLHWRNLWQGFTYYYEEEAIREPSSLGNGDSDYHIQRRLSDGHQTSRPDGANRIDYGALRTIPGILAQGKWSTQPPNSSGKRMTDHVQQARAQGANHDSPFGYWRTKRSVWKVPTQSFPDAHFATFPEDLIKPCILAGCPPGGIVLDPFGGSMTTVKVAQDLGRIGIGLDLKADYLKMGKRRSAQLGLML